MICRPCPVAVECSGHRSVMLPVGTCSTARQAVTASDARTQAWAHCKLKLSDGQHLKPAVQLEAVQLKLELLLPRAFERSCPLSSDYTWLPLQLLFLAGMCTASARQ